MAKRVEIRKTVLDRKQYTSTIDSKFKFFKELEPVVDADTVEELFRLYDKLYALIPIEGEGNSHQYLVERSSELYKIDSQLDSIQPLLDEVASLRGQLLENNRRILELETQLAGGGELDFASAEQMELLRSQLETANATIATLEQANTLANRATEQATEAANKAAEASKKAAEQQAAQATSTAQSSADVTEIINAFKKKKSNLWYAALLLTKSKSYYALIRRNATIYRNAFYWLWTDDRGNDDAPWTIRRAIKTRVFRFLIPSSRTQAQDLTLDFIVAELEQAGYKAKDIVAAIQQQGNFKGTVKVRVITYKDKNKEDKVGYRLA